MSKIDITVILQQYTQGSAKDTGNLIRQSLGETNPARVASPSVLEKIKKLPTLDAAQLRSLMETYNARTQEQVH